MGNAEIEAGVIAKLCGMGLEVEVKEQESEIFISVKDAALASEKLLNIVAFVATMQPDEAFIRDGRLRLWWD